MKEMISLNRKILMKEIFSNFSNFVIMNGLVYSLIILLFMQDFSMKITSNLILVVWIIINSFLGMKVLLKSGRESIFQINNVATYKKYTIYIIAVFEMNIASLFLIIGQVYMLGLDLKKALILGFLLYAFAVFLGFLLGNILSIHTGAVMILMIFGYNFILCNPYQQLYYTRLLCINEFLYNLDEINIMNIGKLILVIVVGILLFFLNKKEFNTLATKTIIISILIFGIMSIEFVQFNDFSDRKDNISGLNEYKNMQVVTKNIDIEDFEIGLDIIESTRKDYIDIGAKIPNNYFIERLYLSNIGWNFYSHESNIIINDDYFEVNIHSPAMLNFKEPELVYHLAEDLNQNMIETISDYNMKNRYIRHTIDGYKTGIMNHALENIFGMENSVSKKSKTEVDSIYESPITKNNFVKRIGLLVINKHNDIRGKFINTLREHDINTDAEYIEFIKENFPVIYVDEYINEFLVNFDKNGADSNEQSKL